MKNKLLLTILLFIFILIFCSCSQKTQEISPVLPEENCTAPTMPQHKNPLKNLSGENFILALVDCNEAEISRYFNGYPDHKGIDIVAPEGKNIFAAADGVISRTAEMNMGYGNHIIIDHDGYRTLYAHCSVLLVTVGQEVKQGEIIALVGNTGNSTGPHLHFEVIDTDTKEKINPLDRF